MISFCEIAMECTCIPFGTAYFKNDPHPLPTSNTVDPGFKSQSLTIDANLRSDASIKPKSLSTSLLSSFTNNPCEYKSCLSSTNE